MTVRRGDGIGIEITPTVARGVRLSRDEPGRVASVVEVPIAQFDDNPTVFDALVRVGAQLGSIDVPTRIAWFPAGSTMQRLDVTGRSGPELNSMRHELSDQFGISSSMLVDADARRWMLVLRWDHAPAWRLQELCERAGFLDVAVEPAPVALQRVLPEDTPVARRDASDGRSWAVVYGAGVPMAAATVGSEGREHPGLVCGSELGGLHDLERVLPGDELADELERVVGTALGATRHSRELDLRLHLLGDPYPPFPAHDLRAPQRIAVALGAGVGAAGLAGRLRPVDVLAPTAAAAEQLPRPWAVERVFDEPKRVERPRPPWWRRTLARAGAAVRRGAS